MIKYPIHSRVNIFILIFGKCILLLISFSLKKGLRQMFDAFDKLIILEEYRKPDK